MTTLDFALLVLAILAVLGIYGWRRRRAIERERERDREWLGPAPDEEPPLERQIEFPDVFAQPPPDPDQDLPVEPPAPPPDADHGSLRRKGDSSELSRSVIKVPIATSPTSTDST